MITPLRGPIYSRRPETRARPNLQTAWTDILKTFDGEDKARAEQLVREAEKCLNRRTSAGGQRC